MGEDDVIMDNGKKKERVTSCLTFNGDSFILVL